MSDVFSAMVIAHEAHRSQVDKAGEPYIQHPLRVMRMMNAWDTDAQIVAILHDVLEDTPVTLEHLAHAGFGPTVLQALDALTHRYAETNQEYWARLKRNELARRVKMADIADNANDARLASLPMETRERLREKYALARAAIRD
jgi:(p)ppGpp synthase/HD superfamily hydrolase